MDFATLSTPAIKLALDQMVRRLQDSEDQILSAVDRLDQRLEWQQLAALREAIALVELGQIEKAQESLIRAEAMEPRAATAKLLLGISLSLSASHMTGAKRITEAYELNPFLVRGVLGDVAEQPFNPISRKLVGDVSLLDQPLLPREEPRHYENLISKGVRRWRSRRRYSDSMVLDVAIAESGSGRVPLCVVRWGRFPRIGSGYQRLLSAFDLVSSELIWSKEVDGSQRIDLASPSLVALADRTTNRAYLYSTDSGESLGSMFMPYYEAMLMPDRAAILRSSPYQRSHRSLSSDLPGLIRTKMSEEGNWSTLKRIMLASGGGEGRMWKTTSEATHLELPFGGLPMTAVNTYQFRDSANPDAVRAVMKGFPGVELRSWGKLAFGGLVRP